MPKKRKGERETRYLIILFLFILGIGLLTSGEFMGGVASILVGVLVTIALFPAVREVVGEIVKGLMSMIEERKTKRTVHPPSEGTTTIEKPQQMAEVVQRIKECKPYKRPHKERQFEDMLMQHLRLFYPNLRTQLSYERTRIDAQIGKVGIEIKYQPNEGELDRLYGQIEKYLRHLDYVIAVIGYEMSRESVDYFRKRLRRRGLDTQVFVISIP